VTLYFAGLPEAAEALARKTDWWRGVVAEGRAYGSLAEANSAARQQN
jgi:hypothetical protein